MIEFKKLPVRSKVYVERPTPVRAIQLWCDAIVNTPEGQQKGKTGDYLVRDGQGNLFFVVRKVFEQVYEELQIGRR